MSNVDRLRDAGIIPRNKKLSREQREAIEGLSKNDVDDLIEINKRLSYDISTDDRMIIMPGRIANQSQD